MMKYLYILIISLYLVGCGGGDGSTKEGGGIKADPTKEIKTKEVQNTPPAVPDI
jgi:hypothetical protein